MDEFGKSRGADEDVDEKRAERGTVAQEGGQIFEKPGGVGIAKTAKTPGLRGFGSFGGWLMGYFCRVRREISERRISPNPPKPRSSSFGGFGSASIVR